MSKKLCVECAHKHQFEIPKEKVGIAIPGHVYIDGEKWMCWRYPPSKKIKCSECGKKVKVVFRPLED